MTRHVYLLAHLPKTGGTTINVHLAQHLEWDEEFVHLGGWGDHRRRVEGRTPIEARGPEGLRRVRVVSGHDVDGRTHELFPDAEARYVTIVREPAARLVSTYNYRMSAAGARVVTFDEWYDDLPPNPATRWMRRRFAPGWLLRRPPGCAAVLLVRGHDRAAGRRSAAPARGDGGPPRARAQARRR